MRRDDPLPMGKPVDWGRSNSAAYDLERIFGGVIDGNDSSCILDGGTF